MRLPLVAGALAAAVAFGADMLLSSEEREKANSAAGSAALQVSDYEEGETANRAPASAGLEVFKSDGLRQLPPPGGGLAELDRAEPR